jgi:hypothetical protein
VEAIKARPAFVSVSVASSVGKGSHKDLKVVTHFDGGGWFAVEFVVIDHLKETAYKIFDEAVEAYNTAP